MIEMLKILLILVVTTQIILAASSWWGRRNLKGKYSHQLGSQISNAEMLEKFSTIFFPLNIKVNAVIGDVAKSVGPLLLINRTHVYRRDLFTTCFTLWHINLTHPDNNYLQRFYRWQGLGFLLEGILIFVGLNITGAEITLLAALVLAIGLIGSAFFFQRKLDQIKEVFIYQATDLLDLDHVEISRAESLASKMASGSFGYPTRPILWMIRFVNPIRLR